MNTSESSEMNNHQEACKTYIEQTKLLTTLASGFIVAPAVVPDLLKVAVIGPIVGAEIFFVISVLAGYLTIAAIAGSQHIGEYNVYSPTVRAFGLVQFMAYLGGIALFGYWFVLAHMTSLGNMPK